MIMVKKSAKKKVATKKTVTKKAVVVKVAIPVEVVAEVTPPVRKDAGYYSSARKARGWQ
jgi:hypothetical protein